VPVPVDVDASTAGLDLQATQQAITEHTVAIVPVHLYGRPVDVDAFVELGPTVIEDAAQAHGARAGVAGRTAALSFYPTKNLGGIGDGGAVLTDDDTVADAVRRRRQHGMTEQYVHDDISQNFRMSEIEAGWLRAQLAVLARATQRRRSIVARYRTAAPWLGWQADHPDHVYHLCVAKVADRDDFRSMLAAAGVATAVHYPLSIGQQPAYRRFRRHQTPVADDWAARCVSLPCYPEMTDAEVDRVADALSATGP
jgi:dTDP-4-amino-4,6-dideoxygalactose transaminase